jgi:JmjC domain, hydroxylase
VYAAQGSLFADAANGWNLNQLRNFLVDLVGPDMPGVTQAMLYFGTWRSMFAFHKEVPISCCFAAMKPGTFLNDPLQDMDLYSVNYVHFGAPKAWYGVPPASAPRLQHLAESLFPEQRKRCAEFTRHKTCVISPSKVSECWTARFRCVHEIPACAVVSAYCVRHSVCKSPSTAWRIHADVPKVVSSGVQLG